MPSPRFKYSELNQKYGHTVLENVREAERLSKSYGHFKSHVYFNLQCKHADIIPKGLKIKSQVNTNAARNIIHKAELQLLNIRISETINTRNSIANRIKTINRKLQSALPADIYNDITSTNQTRTHNELKKYSSIQRNKYLKLRHHTTELPNPTRPTINSNWRTDTNSETHLHQTPQQIDTPQTQPTSSSQQPTPVANIATQTASVANIQPAATTNASSTQADAAIEALIVADVVDVDANTAQLIQQISSSQQIHAQTAPVANVIPAATANASSTEADAATETFIAADVVDADASAAQPTQPISSSQNFTLPNPC